MKTKFAAVLLTSICALSTSASATTISLDGSFGADKLANNSYSTAFSGKASLPVDYTVNGLSFSFTFIDAGGKLKDSAPVQTSYHATGYGFHSYDSHSLTFARYVDITQQITRSSEQESAQLSIGNLVLGSGSTTLETTALNGGSTFNRVHDQAYCLFSYCKYFDSKITTRTDIVVKDYTGEFTISGNITDQSIIDQLLATGELTFNLNIGGNLLLTNSNVSLDYTKIDEPAEVPEPSGVLLVAAGLAGLGLARRRSKAVSV